MARINDPRTAARISELLRGGVINTSDIIAELNKILPIAQQIRDGGILTTGIFKEFGTYDKINAKIEVVTTGMWTGGDGKLEGTMLGHTSQDQIDSFSGNYYYNVYHPNDSGSLQFSAAYGNYNGSGSISIEHAIENDMDDELLNGEITTPSKAVYSQFRSILLPPGQEKFIFEDENGISTESDEIFAITIARDRYIEQMDAGNWEFKIGSDTYIDDSGKKFGDHLGKEGRVFKVVKGTLNLGSSEDAEITEVGKYGLFYPDKGIIILNATEFELTLTGNDSDDDEYQIHQVLLNNMSDFIARRTENVSTQHFFVRATNREFNYSNNPSYVTNGRFTNQLFEEDPKTYITTVGLYNDSNELVAVAKTSQPIEKSYEKEILVKVKLSF